MENRPHIVIAGRNVPPDIEAKFLKWQDEVYSPTYVKVVGVDRLDRYQIVKKMLEYPAFAYIVHYKNRSFLEETLKNPARIDVQKDFDATFYRLEQSWHDAYVLARSFKNDSSSLYSTIVENAPLIHIEGYKVPSAEQGRYEQWFMRWASRVYIPILMEIPGLMAYNCFKLSDFLVRFPGRKYLEAEIPSYVSILYFENMESFEKYEGSLKLAALKRSMEVELPNSVSKIWDVEYQLVKSWRK